MPSEDSSNLHESFDVVVRLEQREFAGQEEEEDDPSRPYIHSYEA